jgi:sulfur carrier protein ThiS
MSDLPTITEAAVTVTVVPGSTKAVLLHEGATVNDALDAADVPSSGFQIRRNGEAVSLDATVEHGDRLVLTRQVKGN